MNKCFGLGVLTVLASYGLVACGEDSGSGSSGTTQEPTGTPTVPAPGVTPGGTDTGTTPITPGTPPPPGPGTVPTPGTVAPTPGTETAAPTPAFPTCGSVTYTNANGQNEPMLDGIRDIFFFGDNTTTACSDLTMIGMACMYGEAGDSVVGDNDYANWGAGMGLHLAQADASGMSVAPWDATAAGVAGLKFTISSQSGLRPVRVQISQVNDPAITGPNYEENAFGWGTGTMALKADMETTIMFSEFVLPSWTEVEGAAGQVLDGSKLHSVQFQIANNPGDAMESYGFCLGSFAWVDATGAPVTVGVPMNTGAGGTGGMSGGGMGGMPTGGGMGGMPTGGGMGGMSGGAPGGGMGGMGGGDVPSFAADIHPILSTKCVPCHDGDPNMSGGRVHGSADVDAAYMSATMMPDVIADRITRGETEMGHMPPMTAMSQLTQDEIDMIVAWVEGGTPE